MTAERVKHIEPSKTVELTARIAELKRQGEKVIGLNVGSRILSLRPISVQRQIRR